MELNWVTVAHLIQCLLIVNFTASINGRIKLQENDVVIVNRPVNALFGRATAIDPLNDLKLHVRSGDRCTVTAVDNDRYITYRPGKLSTSNFPCNFGPTGLQYIHFGGRISSSDLVRLLLRYDSATQTLIIPFSLVVNIVFKPFEIITQINAITVNHHMGLSSPIDHSTLHFSLSTKDHSRCKISVPSHSSGLPQYGYLSNSSFSLTNTDCDRFLTAGIRYKHHARSNAPDHDFIPLTVQILSNSGDLQKQEYFQIIVNILSGQENTPPEPSRNALFVMNSVNQFVMTAITPAIISAHDGQTSSDKLLFNISQPLGPGEGDIVNTDSSNIPIQSFFQHEINDLKIAYKPPSSDSNIKRLFQLEVTILDTDGLMSYPIPLMIVVEPMNSNAPVVTKNTGIQLVEGQSRPVSTDVLEIADEDNLKDVKIYHIDGLKHGHLVIPTGKKYFSPADLKLGNVVYHHDDSESYSDNIIFQMSDGTHEVEFLFPVTIYPKDDIAPALTVNTGIEFHKNDIVEVSQYVLSATDTDTEDSFVTFSLEKPFSKIGIITKRQFQIPEDKENWIFENGIYEKIVNTFTQKDLIEGKIFYKHVGNHITDTITDKIPFSLSDNGTPPNKSPVYYLIAKIHPVDNVPPYLYQNTDLHMEIAENELTQIRKKNLRYADDDKNDKEIKYVITCDPYDTFKGGPKDAGKIVYCDHPDISISRFLQSEINHHKICFQPPSVELGLTTRIIQFAFQVEDLAGNVLPDQKFTVTIKPVNNQPPVVTNVGAIVLENDQIVISPQMLDIQDKDTDLNDIIIFVRTVPNYGNLFQEKKRLNVGDRFMRNDIIQQHIMYQNHGESIEVKEDRFILEITDGVHFVPITFRVKIQQIDDEPSYFEGTAKSGILNIQFELFENRSVLIRPEQFCLRDPDSDVMNIMYVINKYPDHGTIFKDGHRASYFSQREIWQGKIKYEHRKKEIGMAEVIDHVKLGVHDNANIVLQDGTSLKDINVYFKITPENNVPPRIAVGENVIVEEGDKTPILKKHLDVRDLDSIEDDILCMINEQPKNGFLTNIAPVEGSEKPKDGMQPISAFTIGNVRQGDILYVQSVHKSVEPRTDNFVILCSDGINLSNRETIHITIQPSNDEEPEVFVREFIGSEGMELRINSPLLHVVDKDEPSDVLKFIITKHPSHGKIVQQTRGGDILLNNFTFGGNEQFSAIVYEHDGSETLSDSFEFILNDGKHSVSKSIPIIIRPVDDETPRLTINNGLQIENLGDRKVITNKDLLAEDIDSLAGSITYIIKRLPQQGYLTKQERNFERHITLGSNFTQNDIDELFVTYVHTGKEAKRDLIKFDVTDGLNPLIDRYFYVTIKGIDIIYPEVINHGVQLPEGGSVVLTTDIISGTDKNSPDEKLKFTITKAPKRGFVDFVDRPGIPVTTFTQLDLAASRVRYVHKVDDEIKMDSFEFEVTDGFNPVYRTFRIALTDVDNKRPVLMYTMLRLEEGKNKIITPSELKAVDIDTQDENIIFTITQVPLHGNLLYNFSKIVSRFSLKDLSQDLICYQHDGTETLSDSFTFTVTDGTHLQYFIPGSNIPTRQPQEMDIEIIPIDNGVPHIVINTGANFLSPLDVGLGFRFTNRHLQSGDHDSPVEGLQYVITIQPQHGYMRNIGKGNGAVATWTQGDIDRQVIQYVLNPGENATSDTFFFKVADKGGNALENQPFHLNWCWISFKQSRVTVNETQEVLDVVLNRRGYLAETSFVTINVTERTAAIGKDVSRQFAEQVQFNPGQTEKSWHLHLRDDSIYEVEETLVLHLSDPVAANTEYPDVVLVTIVDPEDESTVFFPEVIYHVEEKATHLEVPVHRTGDLSQQLKVICYTKQDTARGTPPNQVLSYSDYITRPEDLNSIIHFDKGEANKTCSVTIIDDSLFEEEERFSLVLSQPLGGRLGTNKETEIVIGQDPADEPKFYFDQVQYHVDESGGSVEIKVWKTGTDLSHPSSVTVKSRQTEPSSAEAGVDYIPVVRILDFAPGEMTKTLTVTILDDLGHQVIEGAEKFELHLRMPIGGSLGEPSVTTVTINDSVSDLPVMEFAAVEYEVLESEEQVVAMVTRSGDLSGESFVRCYTRQSSALVDQDYLERPDRNTSFIFFKPDEREAECRVNIINDHHHEGAESFRLVLGTPGDSRSGAATLGGQVTTKITILDPEDSPVIKFDKSQYTVNEPIIPGDVNVFKVPVIRLGDTSRTSEVRVSTKGGSASAGRDFNAYSRLLRFEPGVSQLFAEIEINYDAEKENSESFSIHLSLDEKMIAEVNHNSRATVYIEENSKFVDVTFPVPPLVVSLRDYDRVEQTMNFKPYNGYPLVCVSPCNPKHPKYKAVRRLCSGIDDSLTKFRWRVGPPRDENGVVGNLRDLETNTVFTTTRFITLDSIYFTRGSNVQCYARAVNQDGEPGMEIGSHVVTVDPGTGLCPPRTAGTVGAEPFSARLRYTGPDDDDYPNTVRLTVQIPHTDGMFPVISTRHLSNFWVALSKDGYRLEHQCSNLLDVEELRTKSGFITNTTRNMGHLGDSEPYQFDAKMWPESTLKFYRNLDLDSCVWTFEAHFDMSELVSPCGAVVQTDAQILDVKQSYVSLRLPLYVSYVYLSLQPTPQWRHFDQHTNLQLKFVYNTAILWQEGITSTQEDTNVKSQLYLDSMRIQNGGNLVVSFQTVANFRGQFIQSTLGSSMSSSVRLLSQPDVDFTLRLLRGDPTFDQPEQLWEFVSNKALQDFSGNYKIQLIPCFVTLTQTYSHPVKCSPGDLMTFDLPIRFQQVSDPVPEKFSLNTEFQLARKRELWLPSEKAGLARTQDDTAFIPGDTIYGRINVDPVQSLGNQFLLNIEKVLLCSGKDGYIPRYDPDNKEYGCVGATENLDVVYRIIDTEAPYTVDLNIQGISFNAQSARNPNNTAELVLHPGIDGFSFDSKPLFQADSGKRWFLHAIYSIRSLDNSPVQKPRQKTIVKRSLSDITGVRNARKGTNMAPLIFDFSEKVLTDGSYQSDTIAEGEGQTPLLAILIGVGVLLLIGIFILVIFICHRRKRTSPPPSPTGTITVMSTTTGYTRVISNAHTFTKNNLSEV